MLMRVGIASPPRSSCPPAAPRRTALLHLRAARVDGVGEAFEGNDPRPKVSRDVHFCPVQFDCPWMDLATARLHVVQRPGPSKGGHPTLGLAVEGAQTTPRSATAFP